MITILKEKKEKGYAEIPQTTGMQFCFVYPVDKSKYQRLFTPFKCRDFFTDVLVGTERKVTSQVYGFEFNPNETPYYKDQTLIEVSFKNKKEEQSFLDGIWKINDIEKTNNIAETKVIPSTTGTHLVIGDKFWQSKTYTLSLYTLLLRLLLNQQNKDTNIIDTAEGTDKNHITQFKCKDKLKNVLTKLKKFEALPAGVLGSTSSGIYEYHNNGGIMSLLYTKTSSPMSAEAHKVFEL